MSQTERKKIEQNKYRSYRTAPIWDVIGLENQGILNWRFRPKYIDVRVKRAVQQCWKEAPMMEAA